MASNSRTAKESRHTHKDVGVSQGQGGYCGPCRDSGTFGTRRLEEGSRPRNLPGQGGSLYQPPLQLSITPDGGPFGMHQGAARGEPGLVDGAESAHAGPHSRGEVAGRIWVRCKAVNRWPP